MPSVHASGLSTENNARWVTTETSNVVAKPLKSNPLVPDSEVLGIECRGIGKAEDVESVTDEAI